MAQVFHNRTTKDIGDVLRGVLDDLKLDEESIFIVKTL